MKRTLLGHEKFNVLLLAIGQALFLTTAVTVMTLSGLVGQRLTPSPELATLPVSAMMLGTLLSTLPASLLMKRIGRRAGFLVGTLAGAAGGALSVVAITQSAFWLFVLASLLLGIYQAFAMYYRFAAADAASDAFRSRAISLVLAGGVISAFLGPWNAGLSGALIPTVPDLGPYVVITVLALLAFGLLTLLRIPGEQAALAQEQRPIGEIAQQPAFAVAVLAAAVGYAVMIMLMTATPLAMQSAGFSRGEAAFVMQWHVLGMFVPSFFTGSLIARFSVERVLLAGALILFTSIAVAVSGETMPHFLIALILLGVGWNFLFIGGSTLLTTTHHMSERGKVQGVNDLLVFGSVATASFLAGALLHTIGWAALNLTALPFVLATALASLWLLHRRNREVPA
ncbi:MFS transporter [Thioalkalivibrio denitrificans]|uniref:MFS transporter n=1 Tax=Thioalkalivibrio denitrificans TaxID=108003 RepID=A0A1V3NRM9_9GAMM|nr:MFS transporter [Thioalkalivibrio denitrificans]OOG27701.1 MFS transporter [Thioalkalivibrio denitrificans]